MKDIEEKLHEYQLLAGKDDSESEARKEELLKWFDEHQSPELNEAGQRWMDERLAEMEADVEDIKQKALRQQVNNKAYKLIPWSYIAKEYFGKSAAWLSQRINGTPVRGQIYTLSNEQKETFNRAVREVGEYIGSFRLA